MSAAETGEAPENPALVSERRFAEKRGNGDTVSAEPSPIPADPNDSKATHARDSLGSRAPVSETGTDSGSEIEAGADSDAEPDYASFDVPGADPSDDVEPFVVVSTSEHVDAATAFFEAAKAKESHAQKKRARTQSQVFSIMQYLNNPETGEPMTSQEHIDAGLETLKDRIYRVVYVWHLLDRVVEVDEGTGEPFCCGVKGPHWHMVIWCHREADGKDARPTIRAVSDAFMVPSGKVVLPNEKAAREGGEGYKGRNAAEKAFYDFAEYLPHETRKADGIRGVTQSERFYLVDDKQETKPGKYQYGRGRVVANFDFSNELDAHMATRHNAAEGGGGAKLSKLFQAVGTGALTLKQVRDQEPSIYFAKGNLSHFQRLRADFLMHQEAPESVMNFYVFGDGGTGKDLLAKALARALAPEADKPYFKVGGANVSWETYDGEPVVIWEDMRVPDMLEAAKSRGMLFRILGPWREPDEQPTVNIKMSKTQLLNRVNIVTGPQDYEAFLRGLAGEYSFMQGGMSIKHEAENLGQGFRRFPVVIPVGEREFSIFVNLGVLNGTREYQSYERYEHMRQDLETLARRVKGVKDAAARERVRREVEAQTVAPIVQHYDRIANPEVDEIDPDALLAEFADFGQPMPTENELRIAELQAELAAAQARAVAPQIPA